MARTQQRRAETRRLKSIFGTTYTVQGSSALSDIPTLYFIKFVLEMGLFFTLLAVPVIGVLRRALASEDIRISNMESGDS
jgi:hypothetical protein